MKARLGELQARLDSHERQRSQQATTAGSDLTFNVASVPRSLNNNMAHTNDAMAGVSHLGSINNSMMLTAHGLERNASHSTQSSSHTAISMLQNGLREHCIDDTEPAFYSHNAQFFHSPPTSNPSPQATSDLVSPTGRLNTLEQSKVSQDFVLDCLHFQAQLMNKRSVPDAETSYSSQPQSQYDPADNSPQGTVP